MHDRVCPPRRMRFSFESRCRLVSLIVEGMSPQAAAAACGASRATGYRLWRRFREGGWAALSDRPCIPVRQPRARRDPRVRYERERPGELLHVDTKKLGRFWAIGKRISQDGVNRSRRAGWQHLHVAIDDHSRLAYCELLPSERKEDCAAFLRRAVARYAEQGIVVQRLLSDNAKAYHSYLWRDTCLELDVGRRYTRPYSPWTNGKAEALIKTLLREWALPSRLPDQRSPQQSAPRLPPLVQPTTTPRLTGSPPTNQPRLTPLWSVQLAHGFAEQPGVRDSGRGRGVDGAVEERAQRRVVDQRERSVGRERRRAHSLARRAETLSVDGHGHLAPGGPAHAAADDDRPAASRGGVDAHPDHGRPRRAEPGEAAAGPREQEVARTVERGGDVRDPAVQLDRPPVAGQLSRPGRRVPGHAEVRGCEPLVRSHLGPGGRCRKPGRDGAVEDEDRADRAAADRKRDRHLAGPEQGLRPGCVDRAAGADRGEQSADGEVADAGVEELAFPGALRP